MSTKYLRLDLEAIRRDFPQVWANWSETHEITPMMGKMRHLYGGDQFALYGDGESFYFLLTKK